MTTRTQTASAELGGRAMPYAGDRTKVTIEVDFCETIDGGLLEMVEDPQCPGHYIFCLYKDRGIQYVPSYEQENQILVPLQLTGKLWRHVNFPKGAGELVPLRYVFDGIYRLLWSTLELEVTDCLLLSIFVLSTWLIDRLPVAPYVAFVGPPGSGKTKALQVLNLLCRRSLLTADISSAAFHKVCDRICPTLLIDETATIKEKRDLLHLLRFGFTPGLVSLRAKGTSKIFGARAVSWLELPDDAALNSRCLVISMKTSTRRDLLSIDDQLVRQNANLIQRDLLCFRFDRYANFMVPELFEKFTLQPRTRDLYRALSIPLRGDPELRLFLVDALRGQESIRATLPPHHGTVLEVLFYLVHARDKGNYCTISQLTALVNDQLRGKGEAGQLSEKRIGSILTTLHLTNRTRTNTGYILWMDKQTLAQIHDLFRNYRSSLGCKSFEGCELCDNASATPGNESKSKSKKKGTRHADGHIA